MLKYLFCFIFIFIANISFPEEMDPLKIKNESFKLYNPYDEIPRCARNDKLYNDFNRYTPHRHCEERSNPFGKLETPFDKTFPLVLSSLILTSFFFDQSIRNYFQDEIYGGSNIFTQILEGAGDKEALFYFFLVERHTNLILQDEYLNETLLLSIQSMITTQLITEMSKKLTGRIRPRYSPDNPFNFWQGGDSFFSGHSSGAWSHLTVVATRHRSTRFFAYGFAASVSLSRIYEDAHWTSDVLMGALVGYTIGRLTVRINNQRLKNIVIIPYMNFDEKCVLVQYQF